MNFFDLLRKCQNLSCPYDRNVWQAMSDDGGGLWFQNHWHCSEECFRLALGESVRHTLPGLRVSNPAQHRIPLGVALISRGIVTEAQIKAAVGEQEESGGPLGEHIRRVAGLTEGEITAALASQWGCPMFNLSDHRNYLRLAGLVPVSLARRYGLVPVRFIRRKRILEVAFVESMRQDPLDAIEQHLRCRTRPGAADASAVEAALELLEAQDRPFDRSFPAEPDVDSVAGEVEASFRRFRPARVTLASCGRHLWVRLASRKYSANLVFGE